MNYPTRSLENARIRALAWTKGFRVSAGTEEFQLVVPTSVRELHSSLAFSLGSFVGWPAIIQCFYEMTLKDLERQHCLILGEVEFATLAMQRYPDRHGRPNVVAVAMVCTPDAGVMWDGALIADVEAAGQSYSGALATQFSTHPEFSARQLKNSELQWSHVTGLDTWGGSGNPESFLYWDPIMAAARRWSGIHGFATPPLVALGANVVLGTRYEAETLLAPDLRIEGYYDSRSRDVVPLNGGLSRRVGVAIDELVGRSDVSEEPDLREGASQGPTVEGKEARGGADIAMQALGRIEVLLEQILLELRARGRQSEHPRRKGQRE